ACDRPTFEADGSLRWMDQPHDGLEGGALADAVPAEEADHFSRAHLEGDAVQDVALAIVGMDPVQANERRPGGVPGLRWTSRTFGFRWTSAGAPSARISP